MASPLTSTEKRRIAKGAREGLSAREIARQLGGRSHTTVATYMASLGSMKRPVGDADGAVTAPESAPGPMEPTDTANAQERQLEPPGDLTMAEVRGWVSSQMRDLQAEAKRCEVQQNPAGAATARRMLTAIAPLAARVALKDPDEDGEFVRVRVADMDEAGKRGADRLRKMLDDRLAERAKWPRCSECGQPIEPSKEENREQASAEQAAESGAGAGTGGEGCA